VYEVRDDSDSRNSNTSTQTQQKSDQQQKDNQSSLSSQQEVQDSRRENRLERRHGWRRNHHPFRHHNQNPFSIFDAMSPFSSPFPSLFSPHSAFAPLARSLGAMPEITIDMFSTPTSYSIHAAVPGLDKNDIKITVEDGVLHIEAERREEKRERRPTAAQAQSAAQAGKDSISTDASKASGSTSASSSTAVSSASADNAVKSSDTDSGEVDYHHIESFYGKVERSLALPEDADADGLTARYENGVIKIEIPRLAEHKKEPRRVEIQ